MFAQASSLNQATSEELPLGGICNGTSDKKKAMEREKMDLYPGHVALGKLLNLSKSHSNTGKIGTTAPSLMSS